MDPRIWLKRRDLSVAAWAAAIGVSRQAAHRYLAGRIPEPPVLDRIETHSGGALTANDFHRLRREAEGLNGARPGAERRSPNGTEMPGDQQQEQAQ